MEIWQLSSFYTDILSTSLYPNSTNVWSLIAWILPCSSAEIEKILRNSDLRMPGLFCFSFYPHVFSHEKPICTHIYGCTQGMCYFSLKVLVFFLLLIFSDKLSKNLVWISSFHSFWLCECKNLLQNFFVCDLKCSVCLVQYFQVKETAGNICCLICFSSLDITIRS